DGSKALSFSRELVEASVRTEFSTVRRSSELADLSPQQVLPALPGLDGDVQSFQVLFHLFRSLLHWMFAEKFSNVGLELGSDQADDAFAHAGNGVIRILVEHLFPMRFHKGPRLFSRVLI